MECIIVLRKYACTVMGKNSTERSACVSGSQWGHVEAYAIRGKDKIEERTSDQQDIILRTAEILCCIVSRM